MKRTRIFTAPRYIPRIPEDEVFARVLSAIRTLKALPDREFRFLNAGKGSCLAKLGSVLTWHDANAYEDKNLEPLERVHAEIPPDISEFFDLPGSKVHRDADTPPMPMRVGDVSYARVKFRNDRMAADSEMRGVNPVKLVPAVSVVPKKEHEPPRQVFRPTRAQIDDALVAGEWWARLALIARNVAEHEETAHKYAAGLYKAGLIADQIMLELWADGWSIEHIAAHSRIRKIVNSKEEVLARFKIIAADLHGIANGTAELADVDARKRAERGRQARTAGNGTEVKVG